MTDARRFSPACERNREPILAVLRAVLPPRGTVLEVGAGTGQHAAYFGARLPQLTWQPVDRGDSHDSIAAWTASEEATNVRPPITYDLFDDADPVDAADALVCINTIHIAPWDATRELFALGARILPAGAPLFLYGPFRYADRDLEPSNARFDALLRDRDPNSGIRLYEEVATIAEARGFQLEADREMPANNRALWFRLA